MNKIDDLFRKKLEGHTVTPSHNAWEKIHNELKKTNNKKPFITLGIAASIALLFLVLFYGVTIHPSSSNQIATSSTLNNGEHKVKQQHGSKAEKFDASPSKIAVNASISEKEPKVISVNASSKKVVIYEENKGKEDKTINHSSMSTEETEKSETDSHNQPVVISNELLANIPQQDDENNHTSSNPSIKIVYNLQPVIKIDSSILKEKSDALQTKENMFSKIVSFARNAKTSDGGLGQLRAAKDDLLRFDYLKNTIESQSK